MLALPLPIITFALATIACGLVWRLDLGNSLARGLFVSAFAVIAVGTLLIGLRFGYGFDRLIVVQRAVPLFIGPVIYLAFSAFVQPADRIRKRMGLHLGIAVCAALAPQIIPPLRSVFDVLIGASYLFYAAALLVLWRRGDDTLAFAPLRLVAALRKWMLFAVVILVVMLVFDSGIAISFAFRRADDAIALISIGSFFSLLTVVAAIVILSRNTNNASGESPAAGSADDGSLALEEAARDLLTQTELYRDTDLTLERLSKRLHVPARALSEAINRTQKMNVSQYVNGYRLRHAAGLLETSRSSVTEVMEQSGFLTRSNFYREFERVYGVTPVAFRKKQGSSGS